MEASPRRWTRGLAIGLAVLIVLLLAGSAYLLGKSSGEDLDAARARGSAEGQRDGSVKGAAQGYRAGQLLGHRQGYRASYGTAYKAAYRKAFDDAGQTPPGEITVPSPSP